MRKNISRKKCFVLRPFGARIGGDDTREGVGTTAATAYKSIGVAVMAANSGDNIMLAAGCYSLYEVCGRNATSNRTEYTKSKDLTFIGAGPEEIRWGIGAEVPDPKYFNTEYNGDYSFDGAKTITFRNLTLRAGSKDYLGFIRADNTVVEDCVVNGMTTYWGYKSAVFKNTTFNCPNDYAIHAYSSPDMLIEKCIFKDAKGKAVKIYNEGGTSIHLTFKDNTVISQKEKYAVINVDDRFTNFTVDIIGHNSISGPAKVDTGTCSRLFGFSNGSCNTGKTIVNFGNTTVWQDGKMVDAKTYHNKGVTVDGVTYDNRVDGANDSLHAEGYKDNKVETTTTDWAEQEDGTKTRTITKACEYCGYKEETTEIDWNVPKSIIAAAYLNTKDHYSYLIGYSDGTVRPNGRITRAEVATIFFRLLTDDARQRNWSSENNFSDVSADKWYNNAVSTLCHMGVLGGYSDGTFRPNAPITRAEFAKIAVSFSQANGSAVYSYFTDVKTTDWFAPYVTAAKDSGLIEGYSDGSFKPENKITRAEACAIVNRVLGRKPSKSHMKISGRIDWPDCTTADWFYEAIMEATNSHTYQMGKRVETWNDKLPQRDWAALENNWASAYTGKGGEVH